MQLLLRVDDDNVVVRYAAVANHVGELARRLLEQVEDLAEPVPSAWDASTAAETTTHVVGDVSLDDDLVLA